MKKTLCLGILTVLCHSTFAASQILTCKTLADNPSSKLATSGFCIQAASFTKAANAWHYEKSVRSRTSYHVQMIYQKKRYLVVVGPIHSMSEAQRTAKKMPVPSRVNNKPKHSLFSFRWPKTAHKQWFLMVGGGYAFPSFGHTNLSVQNNSGFASPYNQDAYTVHQKPQPLFNMGFGRRWENGKRWFPAYSLGLYYQHFFSTNMGNQVTQYTAPGFTNYEFKWDLSSDVLLAGAKLNILRYGRLLPYVTGGLGCALNKSSGYAESALPGLTDTRVSPGYQSKTLAQFAYNLGAGFDFQLTRNFLLSAEYQYQNLGNNSLGHGSGTWSNESLNLGTYRANTALINLTYLIE